MALNEEKQYTNPDGSPSWIGNGRQQQPTTTSGSRDNIGSSMMKARQGYLSNMLSGQLAQLETNYNNNMANYNNQQNDINTNYDKQIKGINQNTYNELERGKVLGAQRGVMNSNQMRAQDQGMIRAGNEQQNEATTARNNALDDLTNQINALKANFATDKFAAQKQYDAGMMQAMGESQLAQSQRDWEQYTFDTSMDWNKQSQQNTFNHDKEMQKMSQDFQMDLTNLDYQHQLEFRKMDYAQQARMAAIGHQYGMAQMKAAMDAESAQNQDMLYNNLLMAGMNGNFDGYNSAQQASLRGLANQLGDRGQYIMDLYFPKTTPTYSSNNPGFASFRGLNGVNDMSNYTYRNGTISGIPSRLDWKGFKY